MMGYETSGYWQLLVWNGMEYESKGFFLTLKQAKDRQAEFEKWAATKITYVNGKF
jgi:hypothetical protein